MILNVDTTGCEIYVPNICDICVRSQRSVPLLTRAELSSSIVVRTCALHLYMDVLCAGSFSTCLTTSRSTDQQMRGSKPYEVHIHTLSSLHMHLRGNGIMYRGGDCSTAISRRASEHATTRDCSRMIVYVSG